LIKSLNPDLIDISKPWFDKEDHKDIMAFRLNNEPRFNDYPVLNRSDPETSSG